MMSVNKERISLQEIVGKGYATFWKFKGDEAIIMGSKGSKKSKTIALRWMKLLKKYPNVNKILESTNPNNLNSKECLALIEIQHLL